SYAAPPAPSSCYAPPPQYQYVRQDPAVPMPSAALPLANSPMSRDEITAHVEEVLSRSTVGSKPRSVANYCKLPPVYFPPSFKAPKYGKYSSLEDPDSHISSFVMESHQYLDDKAMLVHLFHKSLEGEALHWFSSLSASDLASFDTVARNF